MQEMPTIQLISPTAGNKTLVIFEGYRARIFPEPFFEFVQRFCHMFGTTLESNRELAMKHFHYRKNAPLYIASLNHLTLIPSAAYQQPNCFLYNPHQILSVEDEDGKSIVTFLDGTTYVMDLSCRVIRHQIQRANTIRRFYKKNHTQIW